METISVYNNYIDVNVYKKMGDYVLPLWYRYLVKVCGILFFIMIVYLFLVRLYILALFYIIFELSLYLIYQFKIKKAMKKLIDVHKELVGDTKNYYDLFFNELGFEVDVHDRDKLNISYSMIRKIVETNDEYIFIIKGPLVMQCQKENISHCDVDKLNDLIRRILEMYKIKDNFYRGKL